MKKIIFNNPPNEVPLGGSISVSSVAAQSNEFERAESAEVDDDDDDDGVDTVIIDPGNFQVERPPKEYTPSVLGLVNFEVIHGVEVDSSRAVIVGTSTAALGDRILVVQAFRNIGGPNQQMRIRTLVIDADGNPVGTSKSIVNPVSAPNAQAQFFQPLAIAPDGTFLVYTQFNSTCRRQVIKLVRLNPNTGSKIGGPREIQGCSRSGSNTVGAYGVNTWQLS